LPLNPDDDSADAAPVVEPGIQRAERGHLRRELEEAEGGGEEVVGGITRSRA
jgi:hypothetical protein